MYFRLSIFDFRFIARSAVWLGLMLILSIGGLVAQVENVPINNQVYEFLERMGVKGILPLYSNTMIPLSRKQIAELLLKIESGKDKLNDAETEYLEKFKQEFMHEINPSKEECVELFRAGSFNDLVSDKEKYLYRYADSAITFYSEFIGTLEHRRIMGDSYNSTNASLEQHGIRLRGTIKNKFGYYLQATNGTLFGDKTFALSDPRLRTNVKFKDLDSPYFDFTEAYIRADLDWFNLQFGREYLKIGTGYSNRLLLSDNAPVFDYLKMDFQYKSFRFIFLQGSLVHDSSLMPTTNKYFALHRAQISLFDFLNFGISEMIIYQRQTLDFAYLNPINFYKSSEHSLRDRDNAFLNFDLEIYPHENYKLYGTWLIDDIDFNKMGTGWWGNEFGWQGGIFVSEFAGLPNVDGVVEYTRIEPYVYSNRIDGNDYTHNNVGLGSHLQPNSDEWFIGLSYRPTKKIRTWLSYRGTRHGENYFEGGEFINVGGSVLAGHQSADSDTAKFLDGNLVRTDFLQISASYEPFTNFFITGLFEIRQTKKYAVSEKYLDRYASLKFQIEY